MKISITMFGYTIIIGGGKGNTIVLLEKFLDIELAPHGGYANPSQVLARTRRNYTQDFQILGENLDILYDKLDSIAVKLKILEPENEAYVI